MPNPNIGATPGLSGFSQRSFAITLADSGEDNGGRGFRFFKAVSTGTARLVHWDGTTFDHVLTAGEHVWCGGQRINSTGTTGGMLLVGFE